MKKSIALRQKIELLPTLKEETEEDIILAETYRDKDDNVNISLIDDYESLNESFMRKKQTAKILSLRRCELKNKIRIHEKPGEFYEGEVDKFYTRHGYGFYQYQNGDFYEGYFKFGDRSGTGEYVWADGSSFRGEWINDKKNGFGSFKHENYEFDGQWEDDNFVSGLIFKINNINKAEMQNILDSNDEFKSNMLFSKKEGDKEETYYVKTFVDRIEKKFQAFHKLSKSTEIDLNIINFKTNNHEMNILQNIINSNFNSNNNSLLLNSIPSSIENSAAKGAKNLKKRVTFEHALINDVQFKCKFCISSKCNSGISSIQNSHEGKSLHRKNHSVFNSPSLSCTCDRLHSYKKSYLHYKSDIN